MASEIKRFTYTLVGGDFIVHIVRMQVKALALFVSLSAVQLGCDTAQGSAAAGPSPVVATRPSSPLPAVVVPRSPVPLRRSVGRDSLAVLEAAFASPDWMVRLSATQALRCVEHAAVVPWLEKRLADVEVDVRSAAVQSLHGRSQPHATALLRSVQNDTTEELSLRVLAATALIRPTTPCP